MKSQANFKSLLVAFFLLMANAVFAHTKSVHIGTAPVNCIEARSNKVDGAPTSHAAASLLSEELIRSLSAEIVSRMPLVDFSKYSPRILDVSHLVFEEVPVPTGSLDLRRFKIAKNLTHIEGYLLDFHPSSGQMELFLDVNPPIRLSLEQFAAVRAYTRTIHWDLNLLLRNQGDKISKRHTIPELLRIRDEIVAALKHFPRYSGTSFRGIEFSSDQMPNFELDSEFRDPGFLSSTLARDLANGFSGSMGGQGKRVILIIEGHSGVDLDRF